MAIAEELKAEIGEVFHMFDEDGAGGIDVSDLPSALYTITGERVSREDVLDMMHKYDKESDGTVTLAEFEAMVKDRIRGRSFQEEVARSFKLLEDKDMPGYVTRESVRKAAQEIGEKLSDGELAEMFDTLVTGQVSQAVDYATFCSIQFAAAEEQAK